MFFCIKTCLYVSQEIVRIPMKKNEKAALDSALLGVIKDVEPTHHEPALIMYYGKY